MYSAAMTPIDEALIDAAQRAFAQHGFHGTSTARIAQEAGVSRVTLHRRGITKQDVLDALADRATRRYRDALWPALTAEGPADERLRLALAAMCRAAEESLELLVALRSQTDAVFHTEEAEALTRSVYTEPLERLLRDGALDGSLREVDPLETATVLFNMVGWTYVHLRTGHGWRPERSSRATIDIAMHGLRRPSAQPGSS